MDLRVECRIIDFFVVAIDKDGDFEIDADLISGFLEMNFFKRDFDQYLPVMVVSLKSKGLFHCFAVDKAQGEFGSVDGGQQSGRPIAQSEFTQSILVYEYQFKIV